MADIYDRAHNISDVYNIVEDEVGVDAALELTTAENEAEYFEIAAELLGCDGQ